MYIYVLGLARPADPQPGKITHHSIEVIWDEDMNAAADADITGDARLRVVLQKQDKNTAAWSNIYR